MASRLLDRFVTTPKAASAYARERQDQLRRDHNAPVLVAAAAGLQAMPRPQAVETAKRRARWQGECWDAYDAVGEVKYGANYLGNALSRLGLYIGMVPETADVDPQPLVAEGTNDDPEIETVPTAVVEACRDVLARISGTGGHGEMLREIGINGTVAGEMYAYGRDEDGGEEWDIRSVDEVVVRMDGIRILDEPSNKTTAGRQFDPANEMLVRIWQRHPRWSALPDSPLRGVIGAAEELLLTEQAVRASARSRLNAGAVLVPSSMTSATPAPGEETDPNEDPLLRDLIRTIMTPIGDEGDASSVAPMIWRGEKDDLEAVRHVTFERPIDEQLIARGASALRRIAQGMNLPVEVLVGVGDVNHWSAWQIKEETFKAHVEPLAIFAVMALTSGIVHPLLAAYGVPPEILRRLICWFDATRLVARPNLADAADAAHERLTISDAAYRRVRGFDETDAPDEAEMIERIARAAARRSTVAAREIVDEAGDGGGEDPTPETDATDPETPPVVGSLVAAAPRIPADLGRVLRDIDRDLRNRIEAASDATMRRALERVGAALRTKSRKDRAAADSIANVDNDRVAATLGPALVRSLGVDEVEILDGAFDGMRPRFVSWCATAVGATLDLIPGLGDDEREILEATYDETVDEAWTWYRGQLQEQARELLYDPDGRGPDEGEWQDVTIVPFGLVREAVARAGGATREQTTAAVAERIGAAAFGFALGVATGFLAARRFASAGVRREGFEWDYGPYSRSSVFEPHQALSGVVFESFTDDVLANHGTWPATSHFLPGDHLGCRCDTMPVMIDERGEATPAVDVYGDAPRSMADNETALLDVPVDAPAAELRRHPAGGYTHVDEQGEGFYVRQLGTNEGRPGAWRIEQQTIGPDGLLYATRIGETGTLGDARRVIGGRISGGTAARAGVAASGAA